MTQTIIAQKLTKENFEAFGEVIECEGSDSFVINNGTTQRFDALAIAQTDDQVAISIFRAKPYKEITVTMMERHPLGSQAFMPLQNKEWVVVVAKDNEGMPDEPQAFIATGKQGVNYKKNVWHHTIIATGDVAEFLVVDRKGDGGNLEEADYEKPYSVDVA